MSCVMSAVPSADEIDISALKAKYRKERAKRLKADAQKQYVKLSAETETDHSFDPYKPVVPRDPLDEDLDVAILGGGWSGLQMAVCLIKNGIGTFRNIDTAGGFGGTWYWNRYPGLQCDNDAYCYMPMLEEMGHLPTKQFEDGYNILGYIEKIADRFHLQEKALFHTLVTSLKWDGDIQRWRITTNRGDVIRARFVVMAGGTLSTPKLPAIAGVESFKGKVFHTSRWDYDYTGGDWKNPVLDKLADKRVAILGTGATAIQAVPYLARYAKHVYVIQRTPSSVDERRNKPTDPVWAANLKPGWQKERIDNYHRAANEVIIPGEGDLVQDIWTEINNNLDAEREARGENAIPKDEFAVRREVMEFRVMERLRRRVASIVKDVETAEALKPYYNFMCKRPVSNNEYYAAFNQDNVTLIDVSDTAGLEAMSENGFLHKGLEYEIDCMIFASGYEVTSTLKRRWGIETISGRDGLSIYDFWAGGPLTMHGTMAHNFPNMFYLGFFQGGLNTNTTLQFGQQGYHAAWIIAEALKRGYKAIEPSREGQDTYITRFCELELDLSHIFETCPPSYFTNEGETNAPWFLFRGWGLGWDNFEQVLKNWRDEGSMPGMTIES